MWQLSFMQMPRNRQRLQLMLRVFFPLSGGVFGAFDCRAARGVRTGLCELRSVAQGFGARISDHS